MQIEGRWSGDEIERAGEPHRHRTAEMTVESAVWRECRAENEKLTKQSEKGPVSWYVENDSDASARDAAGLVAPRGAPIGSESAR